jgi:uncharacterized paraquat-inducible protein A
MNPTTMESKGACQRCGEHIAFPTAMQGENVPCPHCGKETTLVVSFHPSLVHKIEPAVATLPAISDGMILIAYLLAIFFPAVGFFVGLWLMATKKSPIHGAACTGISVFTALICLLLWAAAQPHNN